MPFGSVTLKPGVDVESTATLSRASYSTSNLGRFRAGLFEKIGGWVKYYPLTLGGSPRALHAWQDINADDHLAVGSTTNLGVITNSVAQNITPQTKTTNFAPNFDTTSGSAVVTIDDSNIANVTTLDTIELLTPISVGGIVLSGSYPIDLVTGTTTYRITAADLATATVNNGGAVPTFTTTNGSSVVTVTLNDHGLSIGGTFVAPLSTTVGGISVDAGTYTAISVPTANTFTIAVAQAASSGATASMNSGNARIVYYITVGAGSVTGTGWGVLGWGVVPWGGTGAAPSQQTGTDITTTDWTLDNWGSTLLACPAGSGVYQWTPGEGLQNAQLVSEAPIYNGGIFVATPYQILIAWGSTTQKDIGVAQDPLTWRASDILDYTYWTPGGTNPSTGDASQAYQNRIPTGSAIKAGMATPNQILLWTDLDLWSLNYLGPPLIWGQTKIGSNCGTVSRHSIGQMSGTVYWQGRKNFYGLAGGAPTPIPCSVWDIVFQDLDEDNLDKCWVETVSSFSEVWFFYPSESGGTGQCDSYAKANVADGTWDYGSLPRSAGIDQSVLGNPIMTTPDGVIYSHETGYDADGQPLVPAFTSGFFYLTEGKDYVFVDQFLPDFKYATDSGSTTSATVQVTFSVINFQGETPRTYGPYAMTASTNKLDLRFRGRQVALSMTSTDLNSFWRIGKCRFRYAMSGRR